jgi:uncharacterized repeat protein (TIGR02543 family)
VNAQSGLFRSWLHRGVIVALLFTATLSVSLSSPASAISQYHSVTFAENDNDSDTVTAIQTENAPTALNLFADLSPQFVNPGYNFVDWNTQPNGSGTSYSDGQTYDFGADIVLYAIWVGEYHTVTFAENDSESDTVTALETENVPTALTSFSSLSPAFVNSGYTFTGWNTESNGSGTSYTDGETYNFDAPLVLYAMWQAVDATATFDLNGGSGSVAPETVSVGSSVSLPSSSGITETGFAFEDWNTASDGSGTSYPAGASVTLSANETFYAQWTPVIQISFSPNGGAGSINDLSGQTGTTVTLPASTSLTNTGFTLTSWNTAANGSGTSYTPGQTLTLTSSLTLYAQWTSVIQISFSANGGVGSISDLSGQAGTTVTLPASTSLTHSGSTLNSWNTAANGSGTSYLPGQSLTLTTSMTLYAQWTATSNVVVSFAANGGSGSLSELTGAVGATVTLPISSSLVKSGYTFTSWNTAANGSGTSYAPGQSLTLTSSLTLYAQWKAAPTSSLYGSIGVFQKSATTLSPSLKAQVARLASVVKTKKYDVVRLFGYSADTGLASLNGSLSAARARNVASYLQSELRTLKVNGVKISASGEGAVVGKTSSLYSCVEVFVQ